MKVFTYLNLQKKVIFMVFIIKIKSKPWAELLQTLLLQLAIFFYKKKPRKVGPVHVITFDSMGEDRTISVEDFPYFIVESINSSSASTEDVTIFTK
jgi:hypothetical protein